MIPDTLSGGEHRYLSDSSCFWCEFSNSSKPSCPENNNNWLSWLRHMVIIKGFKKCTCGNLIWTWIWIKKSKSKHLMTISTQTDPNRDWQQHQHQSSNMRLISWTSHSASHLKKKTLSPRRWRCRTMWSGLNHQACVHTQNRDQQQQNKSLRVSISADIIWTWSDSGPGSGLSYLETCGPLEMKP